MNLAILKQSRCDLRFPSNTPLFLSNNSSKSLETVNPKEVRFRWQPRSEQQPKDTLRNIQMPRPWKVEQLKKQAPTELASSFIVFLRKALNDRLDAKNLMSHIILCMELMLRWSSIHLVGGGGLIFTLQTKTVGVGYLREKMSTLTQSVVLKRTTGVKIGWRLSEIDKSLPRWDLSPGWSFVIRLIWTTAVKGIICLLYILLYCLCFAEFWLMIFISYWCIFLLYPWV